MKRFVAIGAAISAIGISALALAGAAHAQPLPAVPAFNWTGFYLGAHGGYAWVHKTWRDPTGAEAARYSMDDWLAGGQIGFNWQSGSWVIGVEAQASFGEIRKGVHWTDPSPDPWTDPEPTPIKGGKVVKARIGTTVDRLGTIAVRAGHSWDRWLVFAKGGVAWAHDIYRAFNANTADETLIASARGVRWGWMLGLGVEVALAPNWSAKVEYDYIDLGDKVITLISIPGVTPPSRAFSIRQTVSLVKFGVNYRFGMP